LRFADDKNEKKELNGYFCSNNVNYKLLAKFINYEW